MSPDIANLTAQRTHGPPRPSHNSIPSPVRRSIQPARRRLNQRSWPCQPLQPGLDDRLDLSLGHVAGLWVGHCNALCGLAVHSDQTTARVTANLTGTR